MARPKRVGLKPSSEPKFLRRILFPLSIAMALSSESLTSLQAEEPPVTPSVPPAADAPPSADPLLPENELPGGSRILTEPPPSMEVPPLFNVPLEKSHSSTTDASPTDDTDPIAARERARQEYLAAYSVTNPLARTALYNSQTNGDHFFDGLGGIPRPLNSSLFPRRTSADTGFRIGPLMLRPTLSAGYTYSKVTENGSTIVGNGNPVNSPIQNSGALGSSSGIPSASSNGNGSQVNFTATLEAELGEPLSGRFLTMNYGASGSLGSNQTGNQRIDQTLSFLGEFDFKKLRLGLGVSFASLSGQDREFGANVERNLFTLAGTANYPLTEKTSLEWDVSLPITSVHGGIGSGGLTNNIFVNYQYSPKTQISLGVTGGYLTVQNADSQTFEQVQLRITGNATAKLAYFANFGAELRKTNAGRETSPVFGVGATWTPREGTALSLAANEQVESSTAIAGANYRTTSITFSLTQRVGKRVNTGATVGYEHDSYQSAEEGLSVSRSDNTYFAQLSVSTLILQRLSLSGTLTYRNTQSTDLSQRELQGAIQLSYAF